MGARAYKSAERGLGGIIGLSKTENRLKIFDYSDAVYYDDIMIVVLKGREFSFSKIQDLQGKNIGVRRGSSYGDAFEHGKKHIFNANEDTTAVQRLKKLLAGRIDAALIGPGKEGVRQVIHSDQALIENQHKFIILKKPFQRDANYLGFPKTMKMQAALNAINNIIREGYENGKITRIIEKFEQAKAQNL